MQRGLAALGALLAVCALAACGGSHQVRLSRGAIAVSDEFTRLAWNEHNCRAASRYASKPQLCASMRASGMIPAWSHFPLTTARVRASGCGLGHPSGQRQPTDSAGCIEYTARSGFLLHYGMTQTLHGWRIVEIGLSPGNAKGKFVRLDSKAVAVADAFTTLAWNKHDCRAGSRYLLPGIVGGACPTVPIGTFPLKSHHIRPNSCGHGDWNGGYRISPGCIEYTASNGHTLQYAMTKTPQGWRIIQTGTASP